MEELQGNMTNTQEEMQTEELQETQAQEETQETQEVQETKETNETNEEAVNTEFFGKPEAYDYKDVKLPEGMKLNEELTKEFNTYAGRLNLSQKGADDLMAMAVKLTESTSKKTLEALAKQQEAQKEGYKQLLNTDREIGGAKLKESLATANVAYDAFFGDEELRDMIGQTGLNVHPKFIKALKAIGVQMKNDTIHTSNNPGADKRSREDILYPSMNE